MSIRVILELICGKLMDLLHEITFSQPTVNNEIDIFHFEIFMGKFMVTPIDGRE